jgi:hypothetical protein
VASRRTVLGWAATAAGLAAGVHVAHPPTAQAVAPALPPLPAESAGARVERRGLSNRAFIIAREEAPLVCRRRSGAPREKMQ